MIRLIVLLLVLTGCASTKKIQPPTVVTKIVEKRVDLPTWATEQVVIPQPATGMVGDLRESHSARGAELKYVNCRSKLIQKVQAGEKVNIKDCSQ